MHRFLHFLGCCLLALAASAQGNLLLNPSFEEGRKSTSGHFEIKGDDKNLSHWIINGEAAHLFREPKEFVAKAAEGRSALGLLLDDQVSLEEASYATGQLTKPLRRGQQYCVCAEILLHRTSTLVSRDIGLAFHFEPEVMETLENRKRIKADIVFNEKHLINTKWKKFCSLYLARGGERYLSLGRFGTRKSKTLKELGLKAFPESDDFQGAAFYQFDALSVQELDSSAQCGCAEELHPNSKAVGAPKIPYLFALDASHSMDKQGLFDSLRTSLGNFLEDLPNGNPVSFISFSSEAREIYVGEKDQLSRKFIDDKLLEEPVKGSTNVLSGLEKAYASISAREGPDSARIVLISDGRFKLSEALIKLIRRQYILNRRRLILIQMGSAPMDLTPIEPYMEAYFPTPFPKDIDLVIQNLDQAPMRTQTALACPCPEEYPRISNYHFVVDYSGSMREENLASLHGLHKVYQLIPEESFVSITLFNHEMEPLYMGLKSELPEDSLDQLLKSRTVRGGTYPKYGINNALKIASKSSEDRFDKIILITDLASTELSQDRSLSGMLRDAELNTLVSTSVLQFYCGDGLRFSHAHFDRISRTFYTVSREDFLDHLFRMDLSKCDYRNQEYHEGEEHSIGKLFMQEVLREADDQIFKWD